MRIATWLLLFVLSFFYTLSLFALNYEAIGFLNDSASSSQHPKGMYHLTESKKLKAYLVGDADVDLYLYAYSYADGFWTKVAQSNSTSWVEVLNYNVVCGDVCDMWYAWFVVLKSPNEHGGEYYIELKD